MNELCRCPRCQSGNLVSNRWDPVYLEFAADAAQAVQRLGIRELSVGAGLLAGLVRGVNLLFDEFRCVDCQYTFNG